MKTKIYIDASFSDNRDLAGYGAVIIKNGKITELSGIVKGAKNSTEAEIFGVYEILELMDTKEKIIFYNDNMACVSVINGGKLNKKNNKINKAIATIRKHKGSIEGKWVKGHDVCPYNCRADELAKEKLLSIKLNDFRKFELNIYIGIEYNKKRIGYAYIIEETKNNTILYSDFKNIRNGGIESFSYVVSKILGKPFSQYGKKITHINILSNNKPILSLFNLIIRGQKKDYSKILRSNIEDNIFQMLKPIKVHVNKELGNKRMRTVLRNAQYAMEN